MNAAGLLLGGGVTGLLGQIASRVPEVSEQLGLPVSEGIGAGSIVLLLWGVRMLKQERDELMAQGRQLQEKLREAEMKCLDCVYLHSSRHLAVLLGAEGEGK